MDWNYRVTAKANHITIDKVIGDDLAKFPIEKARPRMSWLPHSDFDGRYRRVWMGPTRTSCTSSFTHLHIEGPLTGW